MKCPTSFLVFSLLCTLLASCNNPANQPSADLVLTNAKVYTVNDKQPWAEAIAIDKGKIVYVGSSSGSKAYIGNNTKVADLNQKMVLPGFHDAHIHPVSAGVKALQCDLSNISGVDKLLAKIKSYAEQNPNKPWILGGGWDVLNFPPNGLPDKKLLDSIIPNRPVALVSSDGHSVWANSKALALAGINEASQDPSGGRIDRYPNSNTPSGSLQEPPAMNLVLNITPKLSPQDLTDGLVYARNLLHSYGITGVQDAWVEVTPGTSYYSLNTYNELDASGELNLHVSASLYWHPNQTIDEQLAQFNQIRKQQPSNNIRTSTIKIMQDGVLEVHTAALLEPYSDRTDGHRGDLFNQPEMLNKAVSALDKAGYQIHFHAIGDHAIRTSLDAIEYSQATTPNNPNRHHISHLQQFNPADMPRLSALDVTANFQPLWAVEDNYMTQLTYPKLGKERSKWQYPLGSLLRSGTRIAFGSDWFVSSANPLDGIEVAVTRKDAFGADTKPLGHNEELNLEQAIKSYTLNSAYINHLDDKTGSIEPGKLADLIVLDKNLFEIPASDINETKVTATLFAGKTVHGSL